MKKIVIGLFIFVSLSIGINARALYYSGTSYDVNSSNSFISNNLPTSYSPDLIVSDFSWSPTNPVATNTPVVNSPSGYLKMNVTIRNIGNTAVTLPEGMYITLYKGDLGVGGLSLGTAIITLRPGDSRTFNFTTAAEPNILETAGIFNLSMKVDGNSPNYYINSSPAGIVSESNEENNVLVKRIIIKLPTTDAGCQAGQIYSSVTFMKCPVYIDSGCNGSKYSSLTGQICQSNVTALDEGCVAGSKYSYKTGRLCNSVTTKNNSIKRTLKFGSVGEDVKILQRYLGLYADGVYSRATVAKVKEWQISNGLNPDGSFGITSRLKAGLE